MKRILLKLSGEALSRGTGDIYDAAFVDEVAKALVKLSEEGFEIALVIGAGNIWRGRQGESMDRQEADRMGMLATVINSIYMKEAIVRNGRGAVVMSSVPMAPMAENYSSGAAKSYLDEGKIVILGCGLGIPFLSTDTAGAVRAAEIGADAMLMAKNVDYIYTADPRTNPDAKRLEEVKASEVLAMNLKAIDATATAFCLSTGMPVRVFGLTCADDIVKAVKGESVGTVIYAE
ncbi:MAG: uridine monophosphate kinase [Clostridia bacterium]|nr:uridine monophosphate kinase [Clostridia bacterium]